MKILSAAILIVLCLFGCKMSQGVAPGIYQNKGEDFLFILRINQDSSFVLTEFIQDGNPSCSGRWSVISQDSIKLICSDTETLDVELSNGYMAQRVHYIYLEGKNVFYKGVKLKRK